MTDVDGPSESTNQAMPESRDPVVDAAETISRRQAVTRLGTAGLLLAAGPQVIAACSSAGSAGSVGSTSTSSLRASSTSTSRATSASTSTTLATSTAPGPPNVVLVVIDDMRYDQVSFMPTLNLIAARGRVFSQARCNVPLCQPSRVSYHTGQTSKYNNELGIGYVGTVLKDQDNCLGNWMNEAGYKCGFFGKYINGIDSYGGIDAPKGYDTWREIISHRNGYDFTVHSNQATQRIQGQYSADYLAEETSKFIAEGKRFFCVVAPTQVHAPFFPRKDLANLYSDLKVNIVDEVDVSDKPPWIQDQPPLTEANKAQFRSDVINSLRELAAVDDLLKRVLGSMEPAVRDRTVVIVTSDNGVHRGEHRRLGDGTKGGPYDVGLRVPLIVAGPGFDHGPDVTVPSLAMQDITATILDVGKAKAGLAHQGGISLRELADQENAHRDRMLLHEIGDGYYGSHTGDGITTGPDNSRQFRKLYRYPSVRKNRKGPFTYECYDLDKDPDELANWADDPARRTERDALERDLEGLLAV